MFRESRRRVGALELNVAQGGSGPPVLFLPGIANRWQGVRPLMQPLLPTHTVYGLDYRGHGGSDRAPGRYRALDYYADVAAFVAGTFDGPVYLFGHSLGATLALALAQAVPARVAGVIYADAPLDLDYYIQIWSLPGVVGLYSGKQKLAGQPLTALLPQVYAGRVTLEEAKALAALDPAVLDDHAAGRIPEFFAGFPAADLENLHCSLLLIHCNRNLGGLMSEEEVASASATSPLVRSLHLPDVGHDLGLRQGQSAPIVAALQAFVG